MRPFGSILRFLRLSGPHRRFVLVCCGRLTRMAIGARLQPLDRLAQAIDERSARRSGSSTLTPEEALRLLDATARQVWLRPTCLVSALVGYEVLREQGCVAAFVIGGRTTMKGFEAHAWLERSSAVVFGGPASGYRRIWQWPVTGPPGPGTASP